MIFSEKAANPESGPDGLFGSYAKPGQSENPMSLAPMKRITQAERRPADDCVNRSVRALAEGGRALLGQCSLFRRLSPDERTALLARARVQEYSAHETIFLMDSPGDSMVAVHSGTILISVPSPDG